MKRFSALMIFFGVLLWTQAAISKTWTDTKSNDTFTFTGTTVATSGYLSGRGTPFYQVKGDADISGTAYALDNSDEYTAKMWLMTSGDLDSSSFPGKGSINTSAKQGGVYRDTASRGDADILYKSHIVASASNAQVLPGSYTRNSLSDSLSSSYVDTSYSSPTGLSASPEVYGSLSGSPRKAMGNPSLDLTPLTFESPENKATGENPDDGTGNQVAELCDRKGRCQKPGTATGPFSHRVQCPENIWVLAGKVWKAERYEQQRCPSYWWTCDDDPNDPKTVNKCLRAHRHVKPGERSWRWKYVDPNGNVSQYPPSDPSPTYHACGDHLTSVSGDHSLQASCTSTDSNGNSCTVTSFYACDGHSHSYPSPPPPPPPSKQPRLPLRALFQSSTLPSFQSDFYRTIIDNNLFRPLGWTRPVPAPAYRLTGTIIPRDSKTAPQALILATAAQQIHIVIPGDKLAADTTVIEVRSKHVIPLIGVVNASR